VKSLAFSVWKQSIALKLSDYREREREREMERERERVKERKNFKTRNWLM
jgi:hypothetical protein